MQLEEGNRESKYILFAEIFMLSNRLQTIGDSFFKEISTKQWFVLLVLNVMNGYSPTLNELSEVVGSSHQNVKQLILKLEQKGYVKISKDEIDARRLRIKITPKSYEFSKAYEHKSTDFMEKLFAGLKKEDIDITIKVLQTMKEALKGMEKDYVTES
ncbi:MAG: Transcriptional regulator, MarR family [Herbinix sp.]|jgi:DNA-binding MarR family transcriptional regulator|nr:Transcriptional regulator, MarR family [Herbinix sp.]